MASRDRLSLDELGADYEIIGELGHADDCAEYLARRKSDGADVLVAVARTPEGDEGNALSHLAADINLLTGTRHPGIAPVLDGRWLGQDAYAVVRKRDNAPTLEDLLIKRDEEFTLPRIAWILNQVNATLDWARQHKVVHRMVTPATIRVEEGGDTACVSFVPMALPLTDMPGAEDDARTIAALARAMLTREAAAPERAGRPLDELRPGLPTRVVEDTEALLSIERGAEAPDVLGYIAAIAMADALRAGEDHLEATRNAMETQRREHEAQLAEERRTHDQELAQQREEHRKVVEDQARKFQKEREEFQKRIAREQGALEKERAALAAEREAHRRDCEALRVERETHEREMTQVREQLEWETAALATQQEMYARTDQFQTPAPADRPLVVPAKRPSRPRPSSPRRSWGERWSSRPAWMRRSRVPTVLALAVVLLGAGLVMGRDSGETTVATADSVPAMQMPAPAPPLPPTPAPTVDSLAGVITADSAAGALDTISVAPATIPADFLASVKSRADSTPAWRRLLRRITPVRSEPVETTTVAPRPTRTLDTIPTSTLLPNPDSLTRLRDSLARRRDSLFRRDSLRDTIRRDTLVRRDTIVRDTL